VPAFYFHFTSPSTKSGTDKLRTSRQARFSSQPRVRSSGNSKTSTKPNRKHARKENAATRKPLNTSSVNNSNQWTATLQVMWPSHLPVQVSRSCRCPSYVYVHKAGMNQGHREFPFGNSREFDIAKFPAGIPGNFAKIAIGYFFPVISLFVEFHYHLQQTLSVNCNVLW